MIDECSRLLSRNPVESLIIRIHLSNYALLFQASDVSIGDAAAEREFHLRQEKMFQMMMSCRHWKLNILVKILKLTGENNVKGFSPDANSLTTKRKVNRSASRPAIVRLTSSTSMG